VKQWWGLSRFFPRATTQKGQKKNIERMFGKEGIFGENEFKRGGREYELSTAGKKK